MRPKYPRLFATLDRAIEQSGQDLTADLVYAWVASALKRSRQMTPWLSLYSNQIMAREEGYEGVIAYIAGCALGRMAAGDDPKVSVFESVGMWRRDLHKYWQRGVYECGVTDPVLFGEFDDIEMLEEWLEANAAHAAEPPDMWDRAFTDQRLEELWGLASPGERAAMELLADGLTQADAARNLGYKSLGNHMKRLRQKAAA